MGLISASSWVVSELSDLPPWQAISLLSYSYNGNLYGKLNLFSNLEKMTTSSLWQVPKKVYTSQGKLEQLLKPTRRKIILSQMSRACISLGSFSSAQSAGLSRRSYLELDLQFASVSLCSQETYSFDQMKF